MSAVIEFDETDQVKAVVERFRAICDHLGVDETDRVAGADMISSFHCALRDSAAMGNQVRLEKVLGGDRTRLRIVAVSSQQRRGLRRFFARMLRR